MAKIKQTVITKVGNSYYFHIPKDLVDHGYIDPNCKYDLEYIKSSSEKKEVCDNGEKPNSEYGDIREEEKN